MPPPHPLLQPECGLDSRGACVIRPARSPHSPLPAGIGRRRRCCHQPPPPPPPWRWAGTERGRCGRNRVVPGAESCEAGRRPRWAGLTLTPPLHRAPRMSALGAEGTTRKAAAGRATGCFQRHRLQLRPLRFSSSRLRRCCCGRRLPFPRLLLPAATLGLGRALVDAPRPTRRPSDAAFQRQPRGNVRRAARRMGHEESWWGEIAYRLN